MLLDYILNSSLRSVKKESCEFEASMGYRAKPCLKQKWRKTPGRAREMTWWVWALGCSCRPGSTPSKRMVSKNHLWLQFQGTKGPSWPLWASGTNVMQRHVWGQHARAHTHTATVSCNGILPHHEHDFSHLCCWSKEICRLAAQGVLQAKVIHVLLGACVCVFILKEKRWKVRGRYSLSLLRSLSTSPLSSDIRAQGKQEQTIADCNLTNPARHFMYCCAMGHSDIKSCTFF